MIVILISLFFLSVYLTHTYLINLIFLKVVKLLEDKLKEKHVDSFKGLFFYGFRLNKIDLEDGLRYLYNHRWSWLPSWPVWTLIFLNRTRSIADNQLKLESSQCFRFLSKIYQKKVNQINLGLLTVFLRQEFILLKPSVVKGIITKINDGLLGYHYYLVLNCGHMVSYPILDRCMTFQEMERYARNGLALNASQTDTPCTLCHNKIDFFTVVDINFFKRVARNKGDEPLVCPLTNVNLEETNQVFVLPCGHFCETQSGLKWYLNNFRCFYCNQTRTFQDFTKPLPLKRYRQLNYNGTVLPKCGVSTLFRTYLGLMID